MREEWYAVAGDTEMIEEHVGGCQCSVTTKINFHGRRKPTDVKGVALSYDERRFREVVFHRDVLHGGIIGPLVEWTNGGGVSGEYCFCEGINLEDLHSE